MMLLRKSPVITTPNYSDLAPAIDRVWDDGIESIRVALRKWLRRPLTQPINFMTLRSEIDLARVAQQARECRLWWIARVT